MRELSDGMAKRKRARAHRLVKRAVDMGLLFRPRFCSICGASGQQIVAHHEDYNEPLAVIWVCRRCHCAIHGLGLAYAIGIRFNHLEKLANGFWRRRTGQR